MTIYPNIQKLPDTLEGHFFLETYLRKKNYENGKWYYFLITTREYKDEGDNLINAYADINYRCYLAALFGIVGPLPLKGRGGKNLWTLCEDQYSEHVRLYLTNGLGFPKTMHPSKFPFYSPEINAELLSIWKERFDPNKDGFTEQPGSATEKDFEDFMEQLRDETLNKNNKD